MTTKAVDTTDCCPPTRCPALEKNVKGVGQFVKAEDVDVYVVGDDKAQRTIIVIADIFGYTSGRHLGICDHFANNGYFVIMPDVFKGERMGKDFKSFMSNFPIETLQDTLDKVYSSILPKTCNWVGMIGFCFGSWVVFHESKRCKPPQLKCGVNCHPSVQIEEKIFEKDLNDLGRSLNHPMLLFPTKGDNPIVQHGTFLEKEKQVEIVDFTNQAHGFVSQGDIDDANIRKDVVLALAKALEFYSKY